MQSASFIHRRSVAPRTCISCLRPLRTSFHGFKGVLKRGSQVVGSGSGNPGQPSSSQRSLSNLELLLGGLQEKEEEESAGGKGDHLLQPEQLTASNALPGNDNGSAQQQQQQPGLERFIDWASAAFSSAWGGPLAIPSLQAKANASLEMPKLEPYMSYLLYYAHIFIYGGILAADIYWGPGSAGDLTLALSNDHLAVESGGELWRLATCTFVHSTPINLFVTLAALLLWAADLERAVGLWIFAAIVSLATTSGTVCDLLYNDLPVTQGAIPAVAGTVGALLVEKRKNFLFYEKVMNARDQQRKQRQWRLDSAAAIRQATWDAKPSTPASDPLNIYAEGYGGGSKAEGSRQGLQGAPAQASSSSSSSSTSPMDAYSAMASASSSSSSSSSDSYRGAARSEGGGNRVSLSTSLPARRNRVLLVGGASADGANVMDGWGSLEGGPSGSAMHASNSSSSAATSTMAAAPATTAAAAGSATLRAATLDSSSSSTASSSSNSSSSSMSAAPSSAMGTSSVLSSMVTSPDSSHQIGSGRMREAWEGYEQGYSSSTGGSTTLVSDNLLTQLQQRRRRRRRYIEPPPPKEERHEVATVELFEGLFKFSGVVTSENRAWLSVATTFFTCVDALRDLTSTDDCTISIAGVVGAFFAGALISLGLSPQYTVVLEPVLASNANSGAPLLSLEQRAAADLPMFSTTSSIQSGASMDSLGSMQSLDSLDDMQGEEKYVWGLAVRDKVPATQRFLTVTTALALLSYCVYELLI